MKQREFEVRIGKLVNDKFEPIFSKQVYEFDDDCLVQNLYVAAIAAFEPMAEDGDIIEINLGYKKIYLRYNAETGNGTLL